MKKICIFLLTGFIFFLCIAQSAQAYVSVNGYFRNNGTYVSPYIRSNPNGLKYDNYSWTPSQGLYNKSYGTKNSYWDTPTNLTDPQYYLGQSLYNSRFYTPTFQHFYYSYPETRSLKSYNSGYNSVNSVLKNLIGY